MTTELLLLPEVVRVLVIDDDQICLLAVGAMLESCNYQVTKCRSGEEAVLLLKDDNIMNRFDIILTNLHMPYVNGIKLLDIIKGLELDVPVVIMSSDERRESVMETIVHGACDYIIKPVSMDTVQFLWQHVVRRRMAINNGDADDDGVKSISTGIDEAEGGGSSITKKRSRSESSSDHHHHHQGESSSRKKPRMVWTPALHQQFVDAVNQLGYSNAVPKKITKLMNLPGLTRGIVASHLQKYRHQLRIQFEDSPKDEVVQGRCGGAINGGGQRNYLSEEHGGYVQPPPVSGANAMMQMAQTPYHPLPPITVPRDHHHQPEYYLSSQLTAGGRPEIQPIEACGGGSWSLGSTDEEYGCCIADDRHPPGNTSSYSLNNSFALYNNRHDHHHQSIPSMGSESFSFEEIYEQGLMYKHQY